MELELEVDGLTTSSVPMLISLDTSSVPFEMLKVPAPDNVELASRV